MGARSTDASEIVMLNWRVQWTEEGIRISPDPRHVKDIIEEMGLQGTTSADTSMIVSQPGKMDCDSRAWRLRDATLYWRLVAKLNYLAMDHGEARRKPERCGYGQTQESGALDHLDTRSDHIMAYTDSDCAAIDREDRRSMSEGVLVHSG